jgi:hypothetical protein
VPVQKEGTNAIRFAEQMREELPQVSLSVSQVGAAGVAGPDYIQESLTIGIGR